MSRHASVDDGIVLARSGRSKVIGAGIDNFGYGRDAEAATYRGIVLGPTPSSYRANAIALNIIESDGTAGDDKTFAAMQFAGGPSGVTHKVLAAVANSAILRGAGTTYLFLQSDQVADDVIGVVSGNVATGDGDSDDVTAILGASTYSPNLLVVNNVNGKRKLREHHNDYGFINELHDQSVSYGDFRFIGRKDGIPNSTATGIFRLNLPTAANAVGITVTCALNPNSSKAYVNRTTKFAFSVQRNSTGSPPSVGTVVVTDETTTVSVSSGVRSIAAPTLTAAVDGADGIIVSINGAVAGSAGETAFDVIYKIEGIGYTGNGRVGITSL